MPYPNEHACRVREPSAFQDGSFRRMAQGEGSNKLYLIIGKLKGSTKTTVQAFRYPKDTWTADRAKKHCSDHDGIRFEAAASGESSAEIEEIKESEIGELDMNDEHIFFSKSKDQFEVWERKPKLIDGDRFEFHAFIKEADESEEKRIIEGYANTKDLDRMNEIVEPEAFRGSLKEWMKNPVILLGHNTSMPVGKGVEAKIDDIGLYIKAEIAKGVSYADDAWSLIKQGVIRAFSIGYRILKDEFVERGSQRVRRVVDLELMEISILSLPANRRSLFSISKGLTWGTDVVIPVRVTSDCSDNGEPIEENYSETLKYLKQLNDELEDDGIVQELRLLQLRLRPGGKDG